jgi:3-hydroxyisobutyrate dehydrogenase
MAIGFVGIGIMGDGMVRNLVARGHEVVVWNRTRSKAEALAGVTIADSPQALAEACDPILICVSDTPDVEAVCRRQDGVFAATLRGKRIVDHSTISPTVTRQLAAEAAERGASWLDAPISGGSEGAQRGTLSIMVGGDAADLQAVRPALEAFGRTITHVGPVGAGQTVKLVNQILVVVNQLAVSEALVFAQAAGLDLGATLAAVTGGAAGSWMLANRGPQMIERDWRPGFTIDLQQKDLRLVLAEADELGVPVIGTGLVHGMYRALQRQGRGGEGNHALVKALEQMTGVVVGDE